MEAIKMLVAYTLQSSQKSKDRSWSEWRRKKCSSSL